MKYCTICGAELHDEAVICPKCGCACAKETKPSTQSSDSLTLKTIAKIFMILSCVVFGFYLIPLCWMVPMTVHYSNAIKEKKPVSLGFKICSLLFVNFIAGILMLCDTEN